MDRYKEDTLQIPEMTLEQLKERFDYWYVYSDDAEYYRYHRALRLRMTELEVTCLS